MCGIFGSNDREKFLNLQKLNSKRGDFAYSNMLIDRDGYEINKIPLKNVSPTYRLPKKKKYDLYLGHLQAPTSTSRLFQVDTTHPFMVENWVVAHNGVLTNYKELVQEFKVPYSNPVDTSIIPYMLFTHQQKCTKELSILSKTLEKLKGTFGLWMHNEFNACTYLAKCGVSLFADVYENTFSSVQMPGLDTLQDGVIYQITREGITTIGEFECESPFFTID